MAGKVGRLAPSLYTFVILQFVISLSVCNKLLPFGRRVGDTKLSRADWKRGYVRVNLTDPVNLYGRGLFDEFYINTVGAISFGQPVLTHNLEEITGDVIILAPFLMPSTFGDVSFRKLFFRQPQTEREKRAIQRIFRVAIGNSEFVAKRVIVITFVPMYLTNSTRFGRLVNCFQLTLAMDDDKTYVRYAYDHLQVVQDQDHYARAGQYALTGGVLNCSYELPGSGNDEVAGLWTTSNVGVPGNFYFRIDLPMHCSSFGSACGSFPSPPAEANVYRAGKFMETLTSELWSFHLYYFCQPGRSTPDDRVSIKIECRYDPDYYDYEWRAFSADEFCSKLTEFPSKILEAINSTQVNETTGFLI